MKFGKNNQMAATRAFNKAGAMGDLEVELGKGNRQEGQQQLTYPSLPYNHTARHQAAE